MLLKVNPLRQGTLETVMSCPAVADDLRMRFSINAGLEHLSIIASMSFSFVSAEIDWPQSS